METVTDLYVTLRVWELIAGVGVLVAAVAVGVGLAYANAVEERRRLERALRGEEEDE